VSDRPTLRPSASQAALQAVQDLIADLVAAHDRGDPGFSAEARERVLMAYLRGQRSLRAPWDGEATPVVDVLEDTNPGFLRPRKPR
jgi:hypothetical protein